MVELKKFGELTTGDIFLHDNYQFECKLGTYNGKEYNARCISSGDLWFFDDNDEVLAVKDNDES